MEKIFIGTNGYRIYLSLTTVNITFLNSINHYYIDGLPTTKFLLGMKPKSVVIVDDQFDKAIKDEQVARAFKVYDISNGQLI